MSFPGPILAFPTTWMHGSVPVKNPLMVHTCHLFETIRIYIVRIRISLFVVFSQQSAHNLKLLSHWVYSGFSHYCNKNFSPLYKKVKNSHWTDNQSPVALWHQDTKLNHQQQISKPTNQTLSCQPFYHYFGFFWYFPISKTPNVLNQSKWQKGSLLSSMLKHISLSNDDFKLPTCRVW
jgi:hypothetical protein